MSTPTISQVTRRDVALVRNTLYRLTALQKLLSVAIIAIVAFAAWLLGRKILAFGTTIDYSTLDILGEQTLELLREYNPFFWWGIVALLVVLVVYLLFGFVAAMQRRVREQLVRQRTARQLVTELSPTGRNVLSWSWKNRREPITVGVLQRTLAEMRSDRAAKIELASQQAQLFDEVASEVVKAHAPSSESTENS